VRNLRRLAALTALAVFALTITASAASAEVKWSHTSGTWGGTLTFKRNGTNATTCDFTGLPTNMAQSEGKARYYGYWEQSCAGGVVQSFAPSGTASWSEASKGYILGVKDLFIENNPIGRSSAWSGLLWLPSVNTKGEFYEPTVPFTNGSGATPTKLTFNNTALGVMTNYTEVVTATGTLTFKHGTENVTLSGK
jgi:hypothetical protein